MADRDGGEGTFNRKQSGYTVNSGYNEAPEEGWAKVGYEVCTLPTRTPGIARGDLLKPLSMLKQSNLEHAYSMPSAEDIQELSGMPRLLQNSGEYKDYDGPQAFKDSDQEWSRTEENVPGEEDPSYKIAHEPEEEGE